MCSIPTYVQNINYNFILRSLQHGTHSLYYMYASIQCENSMFCTHDNEKVLAKKAQFVKIQKYVKTVTIMQDYTLLL